MKVSVPSRRTRVEIQGEEEVISVLSVDSILTPSTLLTLRRKTLFLLLSLWGKGS